jgi:ectoine hydroxylase-related dioxygenase (phytanoyl-CoA dioxygenase family)
VMVNVMWALDEFTAENGATRLIPGSHLWPRTREPEAGEAIAAFAPKGSAIIWLGGVLHGGGANNSAMIRRGVIISYKLGWLAPAEKLLLSIEPSIARQLSPVVQRLLGYQIHKPNLGWVEGCDPAMWLDGRVGKLAKIQDNLTPGHEALLQDVEANPDRYIGYTA